MIANIAHWLMGLFFSPLYLHADILYNPNLSIQPTRHTKFINNKFTKIYQ